MGTYDSDGFYDHAEGDVAAPGGEFSALLNLPPEGDVIRAYVASMILALSTNPVDATVAAALTSGTLTPPALAARLNIFVASSLAARDTFWGSLATAPQRLALHNKGAMTVRTDRGFVQQYFGAVADGVPAAAAAAVAGWYIVMGKKPFATLTMSKSIPNNSEVSLGLTGPDYAYTEVADADLFHDPTTNPNRITMALTGDYEIEVTYSWAASATGRRYVRARKNAVAGGAINNGWVAANEVPGSLSDGNLSFKTAGVLGDYINLSAFQTSGGALVLTLSVTMRYLGLL